MYSQLDIYELM